MTDIKIKIKIKSVLPSAPDEWARVTGVKMHTPTGRVPRPVFHVTFSDGETALIPLHEVEARYVIAAADDVSPEKTAERLLELQKMSRMKETQQRLAALEERVRALEAQPADELAEIKKAWNAWRDGRVGERSREWDTLMNLITK